MSEPEVEPARRPQLRWPQLRWPLSRQRLIELLVVIFGVMIALGLENLVEEIRLRGDARELEQAFRDDIQMAVAQSWERQLIAPCLRLRIAVLAQRVATPGAVATPSIDSSAANLRFVLPQAYRAPTRVWTTSTFDRALGSEAFKRIPRARADAYAVLFAQIASRREENAAEFFMSANLAPLTYPQPDLDPEVRADLLQTIGQLDRYNTLALIVSDQIIDKAMTLPGGPDNKVLFREDRAQLDQAAEERKRMYGACIDHGATDRLMQAAEK